MKFSDALEQYLDARERIVLLDNGPQWDSALNRRRKAVEDMREAADVMDKLAPASE